MRVITDNTPLRYLILLGYVEILPALFGRIMIPQSVVHELQHPRTPEVVRLWLAHAPAWLEVRHLTSSEDTVLSILDAGERDAILLMQEFNADLLLIDEEDGYGGRLSEACGACGLSGC